ncbi:hypothetical protein [Sphingomonas pseudosanguinis]|uniref:Uncharacterized protein n=1 Tax=Sphingomonas pseudosanguinis TaxID=413712 RepID=A0A7W6A621_9SPHN|nr:hypothetical protein [Sphingomonas pseudosanguinis]MBB3877804.1 hypothetical protein [Sphingomonas pseudosanguinis]MBN3537679.1 hypothetical protein [Sphingomonas pseudosanguinis]
MQTKVSMPIGTEYQITSRVMSKLDDLPANIPVSFFSLIHDMGFVGDDRTELTSAIRRLAQAGRILMPEDNDEIDLSTPLQSSRLTNGYSTIEHAIAVFGAPLSETANGAMTVLTYRLHPHRCRMPIEAQHLAGFMLEFGEDGLLRRIANTRLTQS